MILGLVALCAPLGDTCLSRGMTRIPHITLAHPGSLVAAVFTPWIAVGIALLIGFFASYLTALSWADLTFVLPATAFGNVIVALLSRFWLHEAISARALGGHCADYAGRGLCGAGAVADRTEQLREAAGGAGAMTMPIAAGVWAATAMIAAVVLSSTAGEVLTAAAMKSIGDLDEIRARSGLKGAIRAVLTCPLFFAGVSFSGAGVFCAAVRAQSPQPEPGGAGLSVADAGDQCDCRKIFLKENVDRRRWAAAVLVCVGVYLLAH